MFLRRLFVSKYSIKILLVRHNLIFHVKHNFNIYESKQNCKKFSSTILKSMNMDVDAAMIETSKNELLQIFDSSVCSVLPGILIDQKIKLQENSLIINGTAYTITDNVYLVGFGKAVAGMAFSLEKLLETRLRRGIISVPHTSLCLKINEEFKHLQEATEIQLQNLLMLKRSKIIQYNEGAENNQPDDASLNTTKSIIDLVQNLSSDDTLIVLISGGGSALLFQPKLSITAEKKRLLCKKLQNAGANITELNCVRKKLSSVKGGGLAKIAYPAKVLALILSDIVGDPVNSIASGPTCLVTKEDYDEAINILKKYNLYDNLEEDIKKLLSSDIKKNAEEKDIIKKEKFKHVENIIIGNNATALNTAKETAKQFNLICLILTNAIEGNVKDVSFAYAKFVKLICYGIEGKVSKKDFIDSILNENIGILNIAQEKLEEIFKLLLNLEKNKGLLLLAGGEPTVVVKGNGKGGRNQELALRFSLDWLNEIKKKPELAKYFVFFLSVGTDGQDGPTDSTGAFGHAGFVSKMIKMHQDTLKKRQFTHDSKIPELEGELKRIEELLPENVLERNDSFHFYSKFENGKYLVKTGLTGTNVMDLHFIYIKRRDCECNIEKFS